MQYLTTHDDALSADAVAADYANVSAFIDYWGASLPLAGRFLAPAMTARHGPGTAVRRGSGDYVAPEYISADYAALANYGDFPAAQYPTVRQTYLSGVLKYLAWNNLHSADQ